MTTETILTDTSRASVDDAIASTMGYAYDCLRVWSAWGYGTMGQDDFSLVAEDSERLREISDAAIRAVLQSPEIQALRKDAERMRNALNKIAAMDSMSYHSLESAKIVATGGLEKTA